MNNIFGKESLIVMLIAVASGCSNHKEEKPAVIPVNVMVDTIGLSQVSKQGISYNGTVEESLGVDVSFQVSGIVTQVLVQKGQHVSAGQLLATVDETTYRNQYNAQLAQQQQAEDNYKRTNEVYQQGSIAEVRKVEAQTNFEQAASTAKAIYQNIAHCRLYSPTDGYVGDKNVEAGSVAGQGSSAFKIVKIQTVKIVVPVPEDEIGGLTKNQAATIQISALNNQVFNGKIDEIGVLSSDNSHNYDVKILVANPQTLLKPGMLADVYFGGSNKPDHQDTSTISVPLIAVQVDEKGNQFVYLVDDTGSKAIRRAVTTGALLQNAIIVNTGLSAGDKIIVSGYHKITDQTPVHITR